MMQIKLTSVMVDEQDKALRFYTEVLGFVKNNDIPRGEYRWLTVVAESDPDRPEIVLEPNALPAAKTYQQALLAAGIPATAGVVFRSEPKTPGQ